MFGALALRSGRRFHAAPGPASSAIWPVRYSLQLIDGLSEAVLERARVAAFQARFLRDAFCDYAGKAEVQCPKQSQRTAVLLIAGQSNAANNGAQRHRTQLSLTECSTLLADVAMSPRRRCLARPDLPASPGPCLPTSSLTPAAFDHVILAPVAVGALKCRAMGQRWRAQRTMIPLLQDLTTHYRVTHVLWHQGETDFALKTDPARYKEQFMSFVDTLRANACRRNGFCLDGNPLSGGLVRTERDPDRPTGTRLGQAGVLRRASTPTSSWKPRTAMTTVTSRIRAK